MLLAVDIGNTNTVLGVFDGEDLIESWRVKTDARDTADELALAYRGLLHGVPVTGRGGRGYGILQRGSLTAVIHPDAEPVPPAEEIME